MLGPGNPPQAVMDRSHAALGGRTAVAATARTLVAAALLSVLLGWVFFERADHQHAGVFATGSHRAPHAIAAGNRLASLPVAAQGPISRALGADNPAFRVRPSGGGLQAASPAQHLGVRFDDSGVALSSGALELRLSTHAIGYGTSLRALEPVAPSAHANRASYLRSGMSEWYSNGPLGLEQGFTIARAPSGKSAGPLTLSMAWSGDAHAALASGHQSVVFAASGGSSLRYGGLVASDARGRALHSWLELDRGAILLKVDASGARYPLRIDPLIQQGAKFSAGTEGLFGASVALSADGSTALIGAPRANGFGGVALVFTRSGSTWSEQGPPLTGSEQGGTEGGQCGEESGEEEGECGFGSSVALSGDGNTALIGGPRDNGFVGAAWAFTREGSAWSQQGAKLTAGGSPTKGRFGRSVALSADGTTALIGAPGVMPRGAAWVFARNGSSWSQQGDALKGGEAAGFGNLGRSVTLSGDGNTALVGDPADTAYTGAVWVFGRTGVAWSQLGAKLTGGAERGDGHFGYSVALSADASAALIGGPIDHEGIGAAWAFTRSGSSFSQQGPKLTGHEEQGEGRFGYSVGLSGDGNKALMGGPGDSGQVGAAWAFARSGSTWSETERPDVDEENGRGSAGSSVALSATGDTLLIGGPHDGGKSGAAWAFAEMDSAPSVGALNPTEGPESGGTEVTITGINFGEATAVTFGGANAKSFTVNSSGSITAVSPGGEGAVPVRVITPAGISNGNPSALFTYTAQKGGHGVRPTLTQVTPGEGPTTGGTVVTISGTNLTGATAVNFGAAGAASFTVVSASEITAVSPARRPETVKVRVTTPGGSSSPTAAASFTFVEGQPTTGGGGGTAGTSGDAVSRSGVLGFGPFVIPSCTVSLRGKTIAVQSYRRAAVKLSWAGVGTCAGRLKLTVKRKSGHTRSGRVRFKTTTIGSGTFSIAPGAVRTVRVNLNSLGRSLLKARHGRLNASIAITKLSPGPAQARTASVRLALQKPSKAKKHKK
jgi:IPT/TIG domain/FG-GAP repeat